MAYKVILIWLAIASTSLAEKHWAVGYWDCRSWGGIRLSEEGYANDLGPEGQLQNWGAWQPFDQNSIIVVWMESSKIEIITKEGDKFYTQNCYGFGISSEITETKRGRKGLGK